MSQRNSQIVNKQKTVSPVPYRKTRNTPRSKNRRHSKYRNIPARANADTSSLLKSLSSINLVTILNSFYTIRSTVKDLRVSLEKLDSALDSAYQMFEIAQGVLKNGHPHKRRPPLQLLPPANNRTSPGKKLSGNVHPPSQKKSNDGESPLDGLLDNVDFGQIMALMQSPMVQGLLKQLFQGEQAGSGENGKQTKEG